MPDTRSRRVVLVTNEILGLVRTGGAGTGTTFLSFALSRLGHGVEILFTDLSITKNVDTRWAREYEERRIRIRRLEAPRNRVWPDGLGLIGPVERALGELAADVVIANDWGGPAYAALRSRQLGLGFEDTLFVVYCHGPNQWLYDARRKLGRSIGSFELQALEQASVELADLVVSPSAFLIEWMRGLGWEIPRPVVIPYFTRSAVDGIAVPKADGGSSIERLAFFGRLEEAKGIEPFVEAVKGLPDDLRRQLELVFVGKETPRWTAERLSDALSGRVKALGFESNLDQPEAIALLERPGTLAVMPSIIDNSPNVVYECLEHGIPFLASTAGGGPELVAVDDRARSFVEPTPEGIRAGLERLLAGAEKLEPARPGFDSEQLFAAWEDVVGSSPVRHSGPLEARDANVTAVVAGGGAERRQDAANRQTRPPDRVEVVPSLREAAVRVRSTDFVLLLDDRDELEPDCVETLLRAQAASGADVVTCSVLAKLANVDETRMYLGEPGALGVVANYYGSVALCRASVLAELDRVPRVESGADWVLLASLSLNGVLIVSVPKVLAQTRRPASDAGDAALAVAQLFERKCPRELRGLARLTASLAVRAGEPVSPPSLAERVRWIWEHEGATGLTRRIEARLRRGGRSRVSAAEEPPAAPDARAPRPGGEGAWAAGSAPPAHPGPDDERPLRREPELRQSGSRS